MRFLCGTIVLFLSMSVQAQTVVKAKGTEVVVSISPDQAVVVGEEIRFLNDDLSEAGVGKVLKVSAGGRALIHLESGKASLGMVFERKEGAVTAQAQTSAPAVVQHKDPRDNYQSKYDELTPDEKRILVNGPVGDAQYIIGGILGTYPGFGIGHAVQGRYSDKGWIFTVGELGAVVLMVAGAADCFSSTNYDSNNNNCNSGSGTLLVGVLGYVGLHIWEIVDVWWGPHEQNERYRQIKGRLGESWTVAPTFIPIASGGGTMGLRLTF